MSSPSPGFMSAALALDRLHDEAIAELSKPLKVVVIGDSGEVSRELVQGLMDKMEEKDRARLQIEVVSAATATALYGYVPEPEPPDMKEILASLPQPPSIIPDPILDRERRDRALSRVHRPHTSFGTFGRSHPLLNGSLAAAICSASLMAHYPTRRPPVSPEAEPDFLTDTEVEDREAGSMVHDQTEKAVMSAAEEKRARKAAKKAENEAKARAGRGT